MEEVFTWDEHMFNLNVNTINEHTGTHIDAPLHFSEDGQSVAEIPLSNLVVPLAIVDIREKAAADPDAQVTPDDPARLDRGTRTASGELLRGDEFGLGCLRQRCQVSQRR